MSSHSLTCYELREELVVAVDDVDRHVSGRLQEERATLRTHVSQVSWWTTACRSYPRAKGLLIKAKTVFQCQSYANTTQLMLHRFALFCCYRLFNKQMPRGLQGGPGPVCVLRVCLFCGCCASDSLHFPLHLVTNAADHITPSREPLTPGGRR